jgi:Putative mono-oxygenase ydhR
MITVLVQFKLPVTLSLDQAREHFESAAGEFRKPEALVRKYFLLSEDGQSAGGVYLWSDERKAREFHDRYRSVIKERFGSDPSIAYFRSPVIVDNRAGRIETDALAAS